MQFLREILKLKLDEEAVTFSVTNATKDKHGITCLVMSNRKDDSYYNDSYQGVIAVLTPSGQINLRASDAKGEKEARNFRQQIIKAAKDYVLKDERLKYQPTF
jgi:hypothetical protein